MVLNLFKVLNLVFHYIITASWESILQVNERLWIICESLSVSNPVCHPPEGMITEYLVL